MSECSAPSVCPECGKEAGRVMSNAFSRTAERFTVVDGDGSIVKDKQVVNSMPAWNDTNLQKDEGVPRSPITRIGNEYYYGARRRV